MRTLLAIGFLVFGICSPGPVSVAAADAVTVADLKAPERAEAFLGLDRAMPFNHETLFSPQGAPAAGGLEQLTLAQMILLAQKTRLEGALGDEQVEEMLGLARVARAALLPRLEGGVSQSRTFRDNLEARGMQGYGAIGPYNTFDARLTLTQKVLDTGSVYGAASARASLEAARAGAERTRQKIVLAATMLYLDALRAQGAYHAAEAGVALSERMLQQAESRQRNGTAAAIDTARAGTRLAEDRMGLQRARTLLRDAYLAVQRAAGIPFDTPVELTDSLCLVREQAPSVAEALGIARDRRLDVQAAEARVRSARALRMKARGSRLPVITASGNYGVSGNSPRDNDRRVSAVMLRGVMALFDSGELTGVIREADSRLRQAERVRDDLVRQVEEDVRRALWAIGDSEEQVDAAARTVDLARQEMVLAEHRFAEGVADHLEVAAAQASLAQSREGYVTALARYHVARVELSFAMGTAGTIVLQHTEAGKE